MRNIAPENFWDVVALLEDEHDWSDQEVRGFLGENLKRIYEANWKSMSESKQDQLVFLYSAFNDRDIDAIMEHFAGDVDWPNGMEGGRVVGKAAVREYWERQWTMISSTVTPQSFSAEGDVVAIQVHQLVEDLDGEILSDGVLTHTYTFAGSLVTKMDIGPAEE